VRNQYIQQKLKDIPYIPLAQCSLINATEEELPELTEAELRSYLHGAMMLSKNHN
jgi:hypothetical protein